MKKLEDYVRSIPDFPEPGIIFRDVTTVLQDKDGLKLAIDSIQDLLKDVDFDVIVGPESRGFIFGVPIAYNMNKPFEFHPGKKTLLNDNVNNIFLYKLHVKRSSRTTVNISL